MIACNIMVFLLGMCVAVQVAAAFYRFLDLWYTIRSEYPQVIRGIVLWVGISLLLAVLFGPNLRNAFLWGIIFYVPFYLTNFYMLRLVLKYRCRKSKE